MVLSQSLPSSADAYARDQRFEISEAVKAVKRQWRRMGPEFDQSYYRIEPALLGIVGIAQTRVAAGAATYIPDVIDELGQSASVDPFARVSTSPLIGVAGDGRPVDSLLYEAVIGTKVRVGQGSSPARALADQSKWLSAAVGTLLSDTGRQSEALHAGVRPVAGFVRMLNAPSCAACVLLAGKWYRKNTGFQRHPKCDCRHIPASESIAGDLTVDPVKYFESLTPAEQDATFTQAGAEAMRNGANMGQVVNARRGMRTSQIGGRKLLTTTEGTTRRGVAYRNLSTAKSAASDVRPSGRYFRTRAPRLMPETIAKIATDRADYLRLLNLNGYMG